MNERIKLPAQEWLGYDPEKGDLHGYTFEQMREFAELIVRECIEINKVETTARDLPEYNLGMLEGYRRARENMGIHFGVE